eukprot:TRINITY_DN5422_c0_g2_i1.p1 TRINITY_DN5422_c0_g2~~TRINITY_DN5422_c0_g2_i1.p1  ORF type:complete len:178 (+),score=34.97 TRINITY_DN5422_c0_g2_i1:59-592(+)
MDETVFVNFEWPYEGSSVVLTGNWLGWEERVPLHRGTNNVWSTCVKLSPGVYQYKYIIDGHHWYYDILKPNVWDPIGAVNNEIKVELFSSEVLPPPPGEEIPTPKLDSMELDDSLDLDIRFSSPFRFMSEESGDFQDFTFSSPLSGERKERDRAEKERREKEEREWREREAVRERDP